MIRVFASLSIGLALMNFATLGLSEDDATKFLRYIFKKIIVTTENQLIIFIQCAQIAIRQYHDNFPDPSLLRLLFPDSYFCCFRNNTSIRLYSFAKGNLTQKVSGHFQK